MWKPTEIGVIVAERELDFQSGLQESCITLIVGQPVRSIDAEEADPWWCPIGVRGLGDRVYAIAGQDSLQALLLALEFARSLLPQIAKEAGGAISWFRDDLDCITPARATIEAYSGIAAEALNAAKELSEAVGSGDCERIESVRRSIVELRTKYRV